MKARMAMPSGNDAAGESNTAEGRSIGCQVTCGPVYPPAARLITRYVRGWFQKAGSQLYVNRSIGTIFSPVRFGAPPEITLYELKRG